MLEKSSSERLSTVVTKYRGRERCFRKKEVLLWYQLSKQKITSWKTFSNYAGKVQPVCEQRH